MWVVHTRPDIACAASIASQTTEKTSNAESNKLVNRIINNLGNTSKVVLKYPKLDEESLRLVVHADVSYNNCSDNRSQLGYIICLVDKTNRCAVLYYASFESTRITRSSMAGETLAFSGAFDNSIIRHDLQAMLGQDIPMLMMTDSQQLFDVLTRSRYTTEHCLMVDIAAAREVF